MTTDPAEHPWVTKARQKLRERGFKGDQLEAELDRFIGRFLPSLRRNKDPHAALHRAIRQSNR